jgi:hypothetical protein
MNVSPAHSPPGTAVTFCLDTKSNQKNQDIGNASFAALAFTLQSVKTTGRKNLPLMPHRAVALQANPLSPFPPTDRHCFA